MIFSWGRTVMTFLVIHFSTINMVFISLYLGLPD
jgi:hypothetical protein